MAFEEMAWSAGNVALELQVAHTAPGVDAVIEQARVLAEQAQADALVGMLSSSAQAQLAAWLQAKQLTLIDLDTGANVARETPPPQVARLSARQWDTHWAMGDWACRNLGRRAFIAQSFYESGYDTSFAFRHGFEAAGGEVAGSQVNFMPQGGSGLGPLFDRIRAERPDFVYALFSGPQAAEFLSAYQASELTETPLLGASPLAEQALLGGASPGIRSGVAWPDGLAGSAGDAFAGRFAQRAGHAPGLFAVMGYQAATTIAATFAEHGAGIARSAGFAAALAQHEPAWRMQVRDTTASVQPGRGALVAELDSSPALAGAIQQTRATLRTGWLHPYLCV